MSKEIGITKGEWKITGYETPNLYDQPNLSDVQISTSNKDICVLWPIMKPIEHDILNREEEDLNETKANAELIIEAGNVTNQSNRTPRQLLEERDRLLELVKEMKTDLSILSNSIRKELELGRHLWQGQPELLDNRCNEAAQTIKDIEGCES